MPKVISDKKTRIHKEVVKQGKYTISIHKSNSK